MGAPDTVRFLILPEMFVMIYLRTADRFDARELAQLRAASLVEIGVLAGDAVEAFIPRATREFFTLFARERMAAWVACDDAQVVGSSCAVFYDRLPYPEGSLHAELCGVYVVPEYRNRGIASELVREVVAVTRASARKTFLRPSSKSRAMYARIGFIETELMTLASV
jgi:GNAT superfamily N-acetyltransferase